MAKKPAVKKGAIELGTICTFPGFKSPALIQVDDFTCHALICGGRAAERTSLALKFAKETIRLKRNILVISATKEWPNILFGKPPAARLFMAPEPEFGIENLVNRVKGHSTIFEFGEQNPAALDSFLSNVVERIFEMRHVDSQRLKLLVVLDGVYDAIADKYGMKSRGILHPIYDQAYDQVRQDVYEGKHGVKSRGLLQLERGVREFRKLGIGFVLTSTQMTAIRKDTLANIWTLIHLGSDDPAEIKTSAMFYRAETEKITRLHSNEGLVLSPNYNYGEPFLVKLEKCPRH